MKKPSLKKVERQETYSATHLDKSDYAQRGAESIALNLVSRLSTCVATALLPPGGHVALVTAAAADLCPLLQRACCSVLTWPAAQRCRCHCALQLRGGGE